MKAASTDHSFSLSLSYYLLWGSKVKGNLTERPMWQELKFLAKRHMSDLGANPPTPVKSSQVIMALVESLTTVSAKTLIRNTQLRDPQISKPQKLCETINVFFLKLPSFGLIQRGYIGGNETESKSSCT